MNLPFCIAYTVLTLSDDCPPLQIVEYSVRDKKYTAFSKALYKQHPKQWLARQFPVVNVFYDPRDSNKIIMHDDNTICVVDKKKVGVTEKSEGLRACTLSCAARFCKKASFFYVSL